MVRVYIYIYIYMYVFVCVECVEILGKKKSDYIVSFWRVFDFVQARNQLP